MIHPYPIKDGSRPSSPQQGDALSATENFLKNFDSIGVPRSTGNTPRNGVHDATALRDSPRQPDLESEEGGLMLARPLEVAKSKTTLLAEVPLVGDDHLHRQPRVNTALGMFHQLHM